MRHLINRRKLNNKGMTLIEVMLAVIILSLVGGVLLKSFSTSAQVNRDAKEKQQAMVLAQSLMESFKSYDTDALEVQFGSVTNSNFELYELGSGASKSYSADASNNKYFNLMNIEFDGQKYDAKAKMTPTSVTAPLVEISDSNVYKDAIFRGKESDEFQGFHDVIENTLLALDAKPLAPGTHYQLDGAVTIDSRVMTMNIQANTVSIGVNYTFTVTNLEYTKLDPLTATESTEYYSGTLNHSFTYLTEYGQSYDNTTTMAALENVYLYYYPLYDISGHLDCGYDGLIIENASGSPKNVYVIKQRSAELSSANLTSGESMYMMNVHADSGAVNLYHNINENFTSGGAPGIILSGGAAVDAGSPWEQPVATPSPLLYNVEIDIYRAGDSTSIHKLNGTVNAQ